MNYNEALDRAMDVANGAEIGYRDLFKLYRKLDITVPKGKGGIGNPTKAALIDGLIDFLKYSDDDEIPLEPDYPEEKEKEQVTKSGWHERRGMKV